MDSYPKRLRHLEKDEHGVDRISELPDAILFEILSYVPTKFAVATTFLSTRWKHLFASAHNLALDFDDSLFVHTHQGHAKLITANGTSSFVNFMQSVLNVILYDVEYIDKIRLQCKQDYGNSHINSWVSSILMFEVKELTISVAHTDFLVFPQSLCGCSMLVKLSMDGHFVLDVPSSVNFPNLEFLSLQYIKFHEEHSVEWIFRGCLLLKKLCMVECGFEDMDTLEISSSSLEDLRIVGCYNVGVCEVMFDTPVLTSIYYDDDVPDAFPVKNLNYVRKATLDLGFNAEHIEEEDYMIYEQNISEFVTACSYVEDLSLSPRTISAIHNSDKLMTTFHNLTTLRLGYVYEFVWESLPYLLEASPNLEVLVLEEGIFEYKGCAECVQCLTESVPKCSSCLREIELKQFNGEEDDLKLVEYFLKSARVLRKMIMISNLASAKLLPIVEKLLMLPSCSTTCEIVLKKGEFTFAEFSSHVMEAS